MSATLYLSLDFIARARLLRKAHLMPIFLDTFFYSVIAVLLKLSLCPFMTLIKLGNERLIKNNLFFLRRQRVDRTRAKVKNFIEQCFAF